MIPDFKTYIGESTWGDMMRRAEGDRIRTEDDFNSYTMGELFDYMKDKYPNVFNSTHLVSLYDDDGVESIEISYYEVGDTLLPSAVVRYVNDTINSIVVKEIEKWSVYHKLMDILLPTKQFSTKTVPDTKVFKIYTKDKKAPDHNLFIKLVDCLSKNLAD